MKAFWSIALIDRLSLMPPINSRNAGLGVVTICFVLFPLSQGFACTWDLNGVGYPASCGYRPPGGFRPPIYTPPPQPYTPPEPSPAEIAAQARNLAYARGVGLNEKGVAAYKAGNFALAISLYEQALQLVPRDHADYKTIVGNLAMARSFQQIDRDEQEQRRQKEIAAADMRQTTRELADSFNVASPPASNLDIDPVPANRVASGSTENNAPNTGTGTPLFGAKSNPPNLDFVGIDMNRDAGTVTVKSSMDALKTAAQSGADANKPGISEEAAKAKSGCQLDDRGCAPYVPNPPIGVLTQSPGATGLADRIRKATSDPGMAANLQWYLELDRQVLNKRADIAAVQKEIDRGGGDAAILNAHKTSLESDLARSKADQVKVVQQMKDQSEKLNITIDWNEAASK